MKSWTSLHSCLLLTLATLACLLPFSGKAFHVDDPLFVWTAQQIAQHPFNPYGFHVVWYVTDMPMSAITKNPPLASYYGALIGVLAGWSERAFHLGFIVPALVVVLGTYQLAKRFTSSPLIAALATLVAPGFLVSATGVMCDVMMLAFWIWAVVFWIEGMDSSKSPFFALSGVLIAACALTKYFGACVMLLLAVYSLFKWRRVDVRIVYLLIPVAVLVWYQLGTRSLYGRGLLWDAAQYARSPEHVDESSRLISGLVGLSFLGGCSLPVLLFAPFLWTRRVRVLAIGAAALAGLAVGMRWMNPLIHDPNQHWAWIGVQFALYSAGGLFVLALAFADYRKCRDAESLLLALWVLGTFFFEAFVNWTVNARSVLPLIPAAAILLARRLDDTSVASSSGALVKLAVPLTLSTAVSLAIAWGDTAFANSGRAMAGFIHRQNQNQRVFFEGHWSFQHYMQRFGARPVEADKLAFETGDIVVTPENTTNTFPLGPHLVAAQELLQINPHARTATMALGAGFYSSAWGPLPFGFGRAPVERYLVVHVK